MAHFILTKIIFNIKKNSYIIVFINTYSFMLSLITFTIPIQNSLLVNEWYETIVKPLNAEICKLTWGLFLEHLIVK